MSKSNERWMTENSFKQLVLVANSIAVFQTAIKMEPAGSKRRTAYSCILRDLRRLESSIPGALPLDVSLDQSKLFYDRLGTAVQKFIESFNPAKPVGRDSKGRFTKL